MKKLAFLLAILSGSLGTFSQNNNDKIPPPPIEESKFSFGVKGAFGHSFIMPYQHYKFMPSWNAGLSAVYSPFVHWGYGLDVLYSQEGSKVMISDVNYSTTLKYIRVPLKVIYFFRRYEADFRPKVAIGPTVGFLTNSADQVSFHTVDFGVSASLGFNYRIARAIWISADAAYYQGLIDAEMSNDQTDLNGNIRLEVGLNFGF